MAKVSADAPVFISYSRKDYYFAESLTLHLLKAGMTAWMDVKDLNPGVFWERDLFAALDSAACVVLVASADSMKSPNVRQELDRAVKQGKRIIVARFRGAVLVDELNQCEVVDFRGAFGPAVRALTTRLAAEPTSPPAIQHPLRRFPPKMPFWPLSVIVFLSVPTIAYFTLADWSGGASSRLLMLPILLLMALGLSWMVSLSFLQRRMGMTRLATTLMVLGGIFALPIVWYFRSGAAGLSAESSGFRQATIHHGALVAFIAAVPFLGLGLILLFRPYDLLRWTPTGKAWNWYRTQCTARVFADATRAVSPQSQPFYLLNDEADAPAAECIRSSLRGAGWSDSVASADITSVLLLSNRTRTDWLLQQQSRLKQNVFTVVATSICLPSQLDWLWKREWIDLRTWNVGLLHRRETLPQVPEAVTQARFPGSVRFANHWLCALAALAFVLLMASSPEIQSKGELSTHQYLKLIASFCVFLGCFELARRLLRRTISEVRYFQGAGLSWLGVWLLAIWAWHKQAFPAPVPIRAAAIVVFLIAFPIAIFSGRQKLQFWFPADTVKPSKQVSTLAGKRNWRTIGWVSAYLMMWFWILIPS